MSFSTDHDKNLGVTVITCPERVDINNSTELRDLIRSQFDDQNYRIVLDMSDTRYVDSSGLGAVVSRIANLRSNNGDVRLVTGQDSVLNLLELTHLNQILKVYPDLGRARGSFAEE